jgi:outer membrane protein
VSAEFLRGMRTGRHGPACGVAVALLLACACAAGEDLRDIYDKARQRDPVYRGALHVLQGARERVPQARAAVLPALSLNGGTGRQDGRAAFGAAPNEDRDVRNWNWTLQLTQALWRPAAWSALDQAHRQERLAEQQFRLAEQELVLRVAQAYMDVLVASEAQRVSGLQLAAIEKQLELATRNFEVGTVTVTDVHEAQSRLDLSRAQSVTARNDLESRRAELERILGEPVGHMAGLRQGGDPVATVPDGVQAWAESARETALQVRIAQAALEVAESEVQRSRAAHSPSLDLTAGYGGSYASGSISSPADVAARTRSGQVGLNFTLPLYAGGGVAARVREAMSQHDKASEDLEAARREAAARARQAYSAVMNGQAQINALQSAVRSSQSAVEANRIGYRIGTRINIDVLNAEQQLYAAQRDLYKARAETLVQGLRLKAANATLDEADLNHVNRQLEP